MADLSDPAIREAGARALYEYYTSVLMDGGYMAWVDLSDSQREGWARDWAIWVVAKLGPVIQQAEIREQMRGGIDDAGEEGQ